MATRYTCRNLLVVGLEQLAADRLLDANGRKLLGIDWNDFGGRLPVEVWVWQRIAGRRAALEGRS